MSLLFHSSVAASYMHVCKRRDPQLNECIVNSIETLRPYLLKGKCWKLRDEKVGSELTACRVDSYWPCTVAGEGLTEVQKVLVCG